MDYSPSTEEADKICVIVHGGKNLQSKKKGRCKFSVIFGVGSKKFRTDVVEDVFGSPVWNEEAELEVEDANLPLVLTVTEKEDILGQATVLLNELPISKPFQGKRLTLQPHKKCPSPHGEVVLSAWITEFRAPRAPKASPSSSGAMKTLKKMKSKISQSPLMRRKSIAKDSPPAGMKGSMSMGDIASFGRKKTNLLSVPSDSLCSINSTDSDASNQYTASAVDIRDDLKRPEISGISPREGPVTGRTRLTLRGVNLGRNIDDIKAVYICGAECTHTVEYESTSKIYVTTIPWRVGVGDILIQTVSGGRGTAMVQYTFRDADDKVSPLPSKRVSPLVMRRTSPMQTHKKRRGSDTSSLSSGSFNAGIPEEEDIRPEVSGISPKEGPIEGGTRLTIRGNNLGKDRDDIICVMICGKDCTDTLEYESSRKLFVTTRAWKPGKGDIVVDTLFGGKGSSTVKFTYLMPSPTPAPPSPAAAPPSPAALKQVQQALDVAEFTRMNSPPSAAFGDSDDDESLLKPEVTGVSPREASTGGGTRITLRGINLGARHDDVVALTFCGADCLPTLEYESPMKLHCVAPLWKAGTGKIVLETGIGGVGSSLVQFTFKEMPGSVSPSPAAAKAVLSTTRSPVQVKAVPSKPPRKPTSRSSSTDIMDMVDSPPQPQYAKPTYIQDSKPLADKPTYMQDSHPQELPKSSAPDFKSGVKVAGVTRDESSDYFVGATPYPDDPTISTEAVPYTENSNPFTAGQTDSASPHNGTSSAKASSMRSSNNTVAMDTTPTSRSRSSQGHESRPQPLGQEKKMSPLKERKRQAPTSPADQSPTHKPPPHPSRPPPSSNHSNSHPVTLSNQRQQQEQQQQEQRQTDQDINKYNTEDKYDKSKGSGYLSNITGQHKNENYINEQMQERVTQSGPTRPELMEEIRRVKIENRQLHEQNKLMKQYLEKLVSDVMLHCPQLLCVDSGEGKF